MSMTQPIRSRKELEAFKKYYDRRGEGSRPTDLRNRTLMLMGLNTALRISDILRLKWGDVSEKGRIRSHVTVREHKTGKENTVLLNAELRSILKEYYRACRRGGQDVGEDAYLFPSPKKKDAPLSRFQAYRIIRRAAQEQGLEHVSCHSLRKTFGYRAWKQGTQPVLLMSIFNHSSWAVTQRYLGIAQDEKDEIYARIAL